MPDTAHLLSFFGLALLLGATPGPDSLFVLMQSAQRGWRVGICVVLGLCTGLVVHSIAVALGLAAVLSAYDWALTGLQLAGGAYMLYLAWGAWHAPVQTLQTSAVGPTAGAGVGEGVGWLWVRRGILMNLTNPKILIFFLAFLPQFTDAAAGPIAPQILLLGALFILATLIVFGTIACAAGSFGSLLQRSPQAQRWLNRLAALVFAALALRLVWAQG